MYIRVYVYTNILFWDTYTVNIRVCAYIYLNIPSCYTRKLNFYISVYFSDSNRIFLDTAAGIRGYPVISWCVIVLTGRMLPWYIFDTICILWILKKILRDIWCIFVLFRCILLCIFLDIFDTQVSETD